MLDNTETEKDQRSEHVLPREHIPLADYNWEVYEVDDDHGAVNDFPDNKLPILATIDGMAIMSLDRVPQIRQLGDGDVEWTQTLGFRDQVFRVSYKHTSPNGVISSGCISFSRTMAHDDSQRYITKKKRYVPVFNRLYVFGSTDDLVKVGFNKWEKYPYK